MKNTNLVPIEFKNEIVITTKLLAQAYETEDKNISNNFNRNKDKFKEGIHYYKLEGQDLKDFKTIHFKDDSSMLRINCLYLWTKRGAGRHCKMLDTDKAWDMFDILEESYFEGSIPQLTETQKLILIISDPRADRDVISQAISKLRKIEYDDGYDKGYTIGYTNGMKETEIKLLKELNRRKNGNDVVLTLTQCCNMLYTAWYEELKEININKLETKYINEYLVSRGLLIKEYQPKLIKGNKIYDLNGNIILENKVTYRLTNDFKEFVSEEGYSFTGKTNDGRKDKIIYNIFFLERFINEHKYIFLDYLKNMKK